MYICKQIAEKTNIHTQCCNGVAVTNSDSQTSKKRKSLAENTD